MNKSLIRLKKLILPLISDYPTTKQQVLNDLNALEIALKPQKNNTQYAWRKLWIKNYHH